jgi:hypothetical protein
VIEPRQTHRCHDPELHPELSENLNPAEAIAETMKLVVLRRQTEGDFAPSWASWVVTHFEI